MKLEKYAKVVSIQIYVDTKPINTFRKFYAAPPSPTQRTECSQCFMQYGGAFHSRHSNVRTKQPILLLQKCRQGRDLFVAQAGCSFWAFYEPANKVYIELISSSKKILTRSLNNRVTQVKSKFSVWFERTCSHEEYKLWILCSKF